MTDAQNLSPEKQENAGTSLEFKICLTVALSILGVGLALLTNFHKLLMPLVELLTGNPLVAMASIGAIVSLVFIGWASTRYSAIGHIFIHTFLHACFVMLTYFLSVRINHAGEQIVTVWAPIIMLLGVYAIITCVARHDKNTILETSGLAAWLMFYLIMGLFVALVLLTVHADSKRFLAAQDHFKSIHAGEMSSMPEVLVFQGAKFQCSMISGEAKCSYTASQE